MITRGISLAVCATLVIGGLVAAAHADNALGRALHHRKVTVRDSRSSDFRRVARQNLHHQIRDIQAKILNVKGEGSGARVGPAALQQDQRHLGSSVTSCASGCTSSIVIVRHRTVVLRTLRMSLSPGSRRTAFPHLPGRGPVSVMNGFGCVIPHLHGVPKHIHQGTTSWPQKAPDRGSVRRERGLGHNTLGGNAVYGLGENGYAYNAHLSAYGELGEVKAGDVIGYVGATGDAGGPHDHFEWHPGNGNAIDPYPYLMAVC